MRVSTVAPLLSLLPLALATECTNSNALPWPSSPDWGSPSGPGDDPCVAECGNDPDCLETCYEIAQQGQCNAVGCDDDDDSGDLISDDGDDLIGGDDGDTGLIKKKKKRSTFECDSNQDCYLYTDGDLLCLDAATGDYVDETGGNGNAINGVYTYPDGTVTTNLGDSSTTPTPKPITSTDDSEVFTTSNASPASTATRSPTGSSGAAATPTGDGEGGAGRTGVGSWMVGVFGVVAALFVVAL